MQALGAPLVTQPVAARWLTRRGAHARLVDVVPIYWELAPMIGVRPEVLLAQAAHETGFGHYPGVVPPEFNNFAGIKTKTGGGDYSAAAHERFATSRDGVRGHVNHAEAYVRARETIGTPHDRYWVIRRTAWAGTCRTTQDIGRHWSSANSEAYGDKLDTLVREMEALMAGRVAGFEFKDLGPDGGGWTEFDDPKLELHSTEGSTLAGAESAMKAYPSHFGISPAERLARQYVTVDKSSYANRAHDTARVYQVEIVGFAGKMHSLSDADLAWIGEKLWTIMDNTGVPFNVTAKGFHGSDEGITLASARSPIRLTESELLTFSGILGHQHMPDPDEHWDPGRLAVQRALTLARPGSAPDVPATADPEDEEMNRYGAWLYGFVRDLYDQYASRAADSAGLSSWVGEFRKDSYYPTHLGGQFNADGARDAFVGVLKFAGEYRPR